MQHFGPFMSHISCNQKHMSRKWPISKFAFLEQLAIPQNTKENISKQV